MNKIIVLFFIVIFVVSCQNNENALNYPIDKEIAGLATPIQLKTTNTTFNLEDYFNNVSLIDSITAPNYFKTELKKEKSELLINFYHDAIPALSEIKVWIQKVPYSLLVEKSRKVIHQIKFNPKNKKYHTVSVKGEFNNWSVAFGKMQFKDSIWSLYTVLNPGRYQYKLVVDGKEICDPMNKDSIDNNIGGYNSLLKLGKVGIEGKPQLFTVNSNKEKIKIGVTNKLNEVFVFWQNYRLPEKFVLNKDSVIEITIPSEASKLNRSFIRIWAYNQNGPANDILIPLQKNEVLASVSDITRDDKEAGIFYFMLVDRFFNGNKSNDKPVDDKEIHEKANYYGGDIAGITQKLKDGYFEKLGINTIWLSPITQNPYDGWVEFPKPKRKYSGYHGYWPISLTSLDTRFATTEEFKELIKLAHEKNMNIILDFVSHHVHQSNKMIQEHPDWKTKLDLPGGRKNIRIWEEQRLTTWFDDFLPTFDFSKKEVVDVVSDSVIYWAKQFDIDGFRHDATKHVPEEFWRAVTKKIKKEIVMAQNKRIYQIGETFGSRELIGSYINSGMQDAQFDFNVYFDARNAFSKDYSSFYSMNSSLLETFEYYGWHNLMGNITGNHDLVRFITIAGDGIKPNEDEKEVGFKSDVKVENPLGYKKLSQLTAFMMTIPGVPIMYYGDEIGMSGAADPDNRRPMKFDGLNDNEERVKENAEKMTKIRKEKLSLIYGEFITLKLTDKTWVYARTYFDEITIVVFNKDKKKQKIEFEIPKRFSNLKLKENFGSILNQQNQKINIELEANSFDILTH